MGSIFRTADAAGVIHLYLTGYTACPPRKEITKTALGADTFVSWSYHKDPDSLLRELKAKEYQIAALEKNEESQDIFSFEGLDSDRPVCLILGNEVGGVESDLLNLSDEVLHIPMRGQKDSLNVSVAFGIGVYLVTNY